MTTRISNTTSLHKIVIVGGGAGGLELACRLGEKFGAKKKAHVTLVDSARTHLWKPLLHEVAAGSLDSQEDQLDFLAQARWHHFDFRLGRMDGLDRAVGEIQLAPTFDSEGREIIPRRCIGYDTLIMAVGSVSNDFGIPGVKEHAFLLDVPEQAERFREKFINACLRAQTQATPIRPEQLNVTIVGGGATGVELAAELHGASRQLAAYGFDKINPDKNVKLIIMQGAEHILPTLPQRLSDKVLEELTALNIEVRTRQRVTRVTAEGVYTDSGSFSPSELVVWAAGIKAPEFLRELDGLESNGLNQLIVKRTLQTTRDPRIFAFGDCAYCPQPEPIQVVPPRAQAAHQQASFLVSSIKKLLNGRPLPEYVYRDFGSLVSLGRYTTVGNLMGGITGGSVMIEGYFARLVYWSLYKMHQVAVLGLARVVLLTIAAIFSNPAKPRVKLH